MLDSVPTLHSRHAVAFLAAAWAFPALFAAEYATRLVSLAHPIRYARSFFGLVGLLSVLPTVVRLLVPGAHVLLVVRILRVRRIFCLLKLTEAETLGQALRASRRKILVFVTTVMTLVAIADALMYAVESRQPASAFSSLPQSVYWAVVTVTTVGYGDLSPQTPVGRRSRSC